MRRTASRMAGLAAAVLAALIFVAPGGVPAQSTTVESSPLEPPTPRLPGGTTVAPGEARVLPGALGPDGQPLAPEAEDAAVTEGDAPDDTLATLGQDAAGADPEGVPAPEGEAADPTLLDLFKRAPPGTGGIGPVAPELIEPVARQDAPSAVLRQLDKLTGVIDTFELAPGTQAQVARLAIELTECRVPVDGASTNHIAFLRIWDTKVPESDPVFSGWMFADSPALSAMDHPRYDVWVIACKTAEGSESAAN